jgi:hypothetical protein
VFFFIVFIVVACTHNKCVPFTQAGVTKIALAFPARFWPLGRASNMGLGGGPAFQVYDGGGRGDETAPSGGPMPGVLTFFALATGVDDDHDLALRCGQVCGNWFAALALASALICLPLSVFCKTFSGCWAFLAGSP